MSIGGILDMARSGMNAQQIAIQTASQNIANADTEGYSRQRVDTATRLSTIFPYGTLGTGVDVVGIARARDAMLDATYRTDSAAQSNAQTTSTALSQVQDVFGEPTDSGLASSLNAFWSSWSNLAGDPTNGAAKAAVREAGSNVASTLNRFANQISAIDTANRQAISANVDTANSLTTKVADYNREIVAAESDGHTANDLRDARDRLLDQLTTLTGGQVLERSNGSVGVIVGGRMLVDGTMVNKLAATNGTSPTVGFVGSSSPIAQIGGTLGAEVDVSATRIPGVMAKLDSLAKGIVTTVNAIHATGDAYDGTTATPAGNFFDVTNPPPSGVDPLMTARGIRLSPSLSDPSKVAAAASSTGPGNSDVATALANLQTSTLPFTDAAGNDLGTFSVGDFYTSGINDLASQVQSATDNATVQASLTSNAQARRQSVSGVSTDEELISVIQHQHSYQAAARLVSVVDDMTNTLVNLGR